MCNDEAHSQFKTLVQTLEYERERNKTLEADNYQLRKELEELKKKSS